MAKSITRPLRAEYIRRNIIRILGSRSDFMSQRELLQKVPRSYYRRAKTEISIMLSENILVRTGLGIPGSPFTIGLGLKATDGNCPCCGQSLPVGNELKY